MTWMPENRQRVVGRVVNEPQHQLPIVEAERFVRRKLSSVQPGERVRELAFDSVGSVPEISRARIKRSKRFVELKHASDLVELGLLPQPLKALRSGHQNVVRETSLDACLLRSFGDPLHQCG